MQQSIMNSSTSTPLQDGRDSRDPIIHLLRDYEELNGSSITELHSAPSALEFMHYVAQNRPFVVRGAAEEWEAVRTWNIHFLKNALKGEKVNVAVTPYGNADSPTKISDGEIVFVKPCEEEQDFAECVDFISNQEKRKHLNLPKSSPEEVRYCQTQNDNLRNEYSILSKHVPPSPSFARIALQQEPEAINLWIGNSLSVTALHMDNYENLYYQILGQKHFVLLPPIAYPLVKEKVLKSATYQRSLEGSLTMVMDEDNDRVPFGTWDPDDPDSDGPYCNIIQPIKVTLNPGDMLYLPTMWYHKVSQSCSDEGICCAVNYWYDMDFTGSLYALCNFVRSVTLEQEGRRQ